MRYTCDTCGKRKQARDVGVTTCLDCKRAAWPLVTCPCGGQFAVPQWRLDRGKGKYCSRACRAKYQGRPKGLTYNVTKDNPSWIKPGQEPWNKGAKGAQEAWNKGVRGRHFSPGSEFKPGEMTGAANPRWVGASVRYSGLHSRLARERGRAADYVCVHADASCRGPMHWANISHEYRDVQDFMPLCQSHHRRYDRQARMAAR